MDHVMMGEDEGEGGGGGEDGVVDLMMRRQS